MIGPLHLTFKPNHPPSTSNSHSRSTSLTLTLTTTTTHSHTYSPSHTPPHSLTHSLTLTLPLEGDPFLDNCLIDPQGDFVAWYGQIDQHTHPGWSNRPTHSPRVANGVYVLHSPQGGLRGCGRGAVTFRCRVLRDWFVYLTHSLTHSRTHSRMHPVTHARTYSLTHSLTHSLMYAPSHSRTHLRTHSLMHVLTHPLTHLPTQALRGVCVIVPRLCME